MEECSLFWEWNGFPLLVFGLENKGQSELDNLQSCLGAAVQEKLGCVFAGLEKDGASVALG